MEKLRFTLFIAIVCAVISCDNKNEQTNNGRDTGAETSAKQQNEYPDLTLRLVNSGEEVSARSLQGNNLFFLFQPDCDHCQEEAAQVEQRLKDFKDYTLYFISSAPVEQIEAFANTYKLSDKENVKFAWTSTEGVLNYYGAIRTPSVYIYSDGKLKGSFNGQTDIQNILNAL